ncbi:MAG: 2-succinyl-5-enolpyruvyl-6-hydroxy-3-cyclohexene-1-carboxylic-acid synthase, partial [Candidatus Velamenicoccus archaeovorus]
MSTPPGAEPSPASGAMGQAEEAFARMRAFVGALASAGVRHACLSPGSRSTPLALALRREPRIVLHVHLDERASGFAALGLAKSTGAPSAVACTSGTAAAELLPAAVEARMSRTPLLLLTADRPPELRGVGANQTIDQVELFGRYARWFVDAPVAGSGEGDDPWRLLAREVVRRTLEHPPGPVHVNLPFREPLVPDPEPTRYPPSPARPAPQPEEPSGAPPRFDPPPPRPEQLEAVVDRIGGVDRGVVYAGALRVGARPILELARALGWPLIAEPTSGLRVPGALAAGQPLLADERFRSAHRPEVAIQVGAAPTSRPALALVGEAEHLIVLDPDDLVADPARHAELRLVAHPAEVAGGLLERLPAGGAGGWLQGWHRADGRARGAIDGLLDGWDEPFEGRAARDLAEAVPDGAVVWAGSSMPVRDLDAFMRPREGIRVLANRGASGIDGFVSTVLGGAAAGHPTFAVLGDLTLLHDAGSLLWSARRGHDAVLVVPNNDGGGIFSFLGQRGLPGSELAELFTTPHGLSLGEVAAAAGAGHVLVERAGDLAPAVERAHRAGGVWIVEVPSDRERNV